MKKLIVILALLFLALLPAQQLAFPTALGAGAYATGGRAYSTVVHVTNLNDSGTGSFRAALGDNRTIVFDVSGVINLSSAIDTTINNVTIAGQTAPGDGITFTGETIILKGDNLIIRYLRFRGASSSSDSFNLYYATNVIADHLSISFGNDEGMTVGSDTSLTTSDLTVQYCFFGVNESGGGIVGDGSNNYMDYIEDISYIGNVFHNNEQRYPNLALDGRVDLINNVSWNAEKRLVRGNGSYQLNHINNYYDYGVSIQDENFNMHSYSATSTPTIYTNGNKISNPYGVDARPEYSMTSTVSEMNADNWLMWRWFLTASTPYGTVDRGDQLTTDYQTLSQYTLLGRTFTPITADEAKDSIPNNAGAFKSLNADGSVTVNRDSYDTSWLNEINTDTRSAITDRPYPTPTLSTASRPASYDTDNDGMPDTWETAKGLNPNVADNNGNDLDVGYTNLEMFLNQVDDNIAEPTPTVNVTSVQGLPDTLTISVGETYDFTEEVLPANATDKTVVWSRSNTSVATVDQNGTITATAKGTVSITVTTNDGGFTDTCVVTVNEVSSGGSNGSSTSKKLKLILISN